MGRIRKTQSRSAFLSYLVMILITPLMILKWIGEGLIILGRIFLFILSISYKLNYSLFNLAKKSFNSILNWFLKRSDVSKIKWRSKKFKRQRGKSRGIIFRYSQIFWPKIKLSLPSIFFKPWFYWQMLFLKIRYFLLGSLTIGLVASLYFSFLLVKSLPNPNFLTFRDIPSTTKIFDRNGKLLYEIYEKENRTPLPISAIPEIVKQATIAIEDKEFYVHRGLSLTGITRAFLHNLNSETLEGGSTITQQLVRSVFLSPDKTIIRKTLEAILSIWTEQLYSKEQILEMYLNQVPYGGTAWGIEAASQTYFGKKTNELTLAETTLLAGLPASPSRFSPFGMNPTLAKIRQEEVLKRMVEDGYISKQQKDEAIAETLNFREPTIPIHAPHFVMYVKNLLESRYGTRLVDRGGLQVTTTLDSSLQEMAQEVVANRIDALRPLNVGNAAVLITDPKKGEILAMVGSANYFDKENEGNVNVALSPRQPGSSIKVVTYAAALANGFTAATVLDDSPITYRIDNQYAYSPVNYDGRFHGRIPLRTALASSYNVPAVKTLSKIGLEKMINLAKLMGINSWKDKNRYGLSLTLGGGEVTMMEMAEVYGTLASYGIRRDLNPILMVTNLKGDKLPLPIQKNEVKATSEGIAFILSSILSDNTARIPAFGQNSSLIIPGKTVAVKTGTSDNKRDNWTIGYTPSFVVTVWVGNNDNSPMNPQLTSGVTGAAPIWNEIMTNLLKDKADEPFFPSEDIASLSCYGRLEYFLRGTEPKGGCPRSLPLSPTPLPTQ